MASRNASASNAQGSVARRKRWIARAESSSGRRACRSAAAYLPQLARDGKLPEPPTEHGDQPELRIIQCLERTVERATEWLEQTDLVESTIAGRRKAPELAQDTFSRRPGDERGRCSQQIFRALVHAEPKLVLEPNGSQQAQRIVAEDRLGHRTNDAGLEIRRAFVRVVHVVTPDPNSDGVEREVARGQIRVDPARERREVDGLARSPP